VSFQASAYEAMGRLDSLQARYPEHMYVAAMGWMLRGCYDSVVTSPLMSPRRRAEALGAMGRPADIPKRFPLLRKLAATAFLDNRSYDMLLSQYRDQREERALALALSGHVREVLEEYPDRRDACAIALCEQGGFDQAVSRFPERRGEHVQYLFAAGRYGDIAEHYSDYVAFYAMALTRLGRAEEVPWENTRFVLSGVDRAYAHAFAALHAEERKRPRSTDSVLQEQPMLQYGAGWNKAFFDCHLLGPVLHALRGDRNALPGAHAYIDAHHREHFAQQLWYASAFLAGAIDSSAYLQQPHGRCVHDRYQLYQAIIDELNGRQAHALVRYRSYDALPLASRLQTQQPVMEDIAYSPVTRAFVRWRIRVLAGQG
jgi:hypothetical protein